MRITAKLHTGMLLLVVALSLAAEKSPGLSEWRTHNPTQDTTHMWMANSYPLVCDSLLPITPLQDRRMIFDFQWRIVVRRLPAFPNVPEYQFTVSKRMDGGIVFTANLPVNKSIAEQMEQLHSEHPEATLSEVLKGVSIASETLCVKPASEAWTLIGQLDSIRISPMHARGMVMDGSAVEFVSQADWGRKLHLCLIEPVSEKSNHPLLKWIESMYEVLVKRLQTR